MCRRRGQPSQGQLDRSVPVQVDVCLEEREQTLSRDEIPAAGCVEHCGRLEHLAAEPQQGHRDHNEQERGIRVRVLSREEVRLLEISAQR